jgi:hypothetical protein
MTGESWNGELKGVVQAKKLYTGRKLNISSYTLDM